MANVPQQKLYCVRLMIRGRCCMANVPQQKLCCVRLMIRGRCCMAKVPQTKGCILYAFANVNTQNIFHLQLVCQHR